jgi:hypothetical protein
VRQATPAFPAVYENGFYTAHNPEVADILPPELREKLRDVFLQFRTACYQYRSLHGCTCELQTMGGCGLKTVLENNGSLPCAQNYFPAVEINEDFRRQLQGCEAEY